MSLSLSVLVLTSDIPAQTLNMTKSFPLTLTSLDTVVIYYLFSLFQLLCHTWGQHLEQQSITYPLLFL